MPVSLSKAILNTLIYADIFDYPLKLKEIEKWLIRVRGQPACRRGRVSGVRIILGNSELIKEKDGFYHLKGRKEIVALRHNREKYAEEKLKIARKITSVIQLIPTVKLIGITGNLAINNTEKDDDIDLLIITCKGSLWITRLLVTLLTEFTGLRRHPSDIDVANKICLNMFLEENNLALPEKERDLFSAHEIVQIKPLFDRDFTYQKFLLVNKWVVKYLPNAIRIKNYEARIKNKNILILNYSIAKLLNCLEVFLKKSQLWYMRKRMTKEVVRNGIIRFHPQDAREWILREYRLRIEKYPDIKSI